MISYGVNIFIVLLQVSRGNEPGKSIINVAIIPSFKKAILILGIICTQSRYFDFFFRILLLLCLICLGIYFVFDASVKTVVGNLNTKTASKTRHRINGMSERKEGKVLYCNLVLDFPLQICYIIFKSLIRFGKQILFILLFQIVYFCFASH